MHGITPYLTRNTKGMLHRKRTRNKEQEFVGGGKGCVGYWFWKQSKRTGAKNTLHLLFNLVRVGAGPRKKSISMSKNSKHAIDPVEKFITDEKARPAIWFIVAFAPISRVFIIDTSPSCQIKVNIHTLSNPINYQPDWKATALPAAISIRVHMKLGPRKNAFILCFKVVVVLSSSIVFGAITWCPCSAISSTVDTSVLDSSALLLTASIITVCANKIKEKDKRHCSFVRKFSKDQMV